MVDVAYGTPIYYLQEEDDCGWRKWRHKAMENDGLTDLSTDNSPRVIFKHCSPRQLSLRELL